MSLCHDSRDLVVLALTQRLKSHSAHHEAAAGIAVAARVLQHVDCLAAAPGMGCTTSGCMLFCKETQGNMDMGTYFLRRVLRLDFPFRSASGVGSVAQVPAILYWFVASSRFVCGLPLSTWKARRT